MKLRRRQLVGTLLLVPAFSALFPTTADGKDASASERLRGKLEAPTEDQAGLRLPDGSFVELHGDEQTTKVLRDERLRGLDFEVHGRRRADGSFDILPIHLAALFTYLGSKLMRVTYYCDVCSIRTFSPGMCMCCREDTRVDIVDPDSITKAAGA